jgi:hypothetical protein
VGVDFHENHHVGGRHFVSVRLLDSSALAENTLGGLTAYTLQSKRQNGSQILLFVPTVPASEALYSRPIGLDR